MRSTTLTRDHLPFVPYIDWKPKESPDPIKLFMELVCLVECVVRQFSVPEDERIQK